jgi:hypothetical protein
MAKLKVIKKEEPKLGSEPVIVNNEIILGVTPCIRCNKPSTILSPDNKPFCSLGCKSASELS